MATQRCPKCSRKPDTEMTQSMQAVQDMLGMSEPESLESQGIHVCLVGRTTIDPIVYGKAARGVNPLDKLTLGDLAIIYGEDTYTPICWDEKMGTGYDKDYFNTQLSYRIEFDPILIAPGFRPYDEGFTMIIDDDTDGCWDKALVHIIDGHVLPSLLRKNDAYYCRLVSYNEYGRPYLWGTRRLEHHHTTGWSFSNWC